MALLGPMLRRLFTGSVAASGPQSNVDESIATIRQAMLAALGVACIGDRHTGLRRRIVHASDLERLWHLRSALMAALAALHGEAAARATLVEISEEFEGLLPGDLSSRSSPLGNH